MAVGNPQGKASGGAGMTRPTPAAIRAAAEMAAKLGVTIRLEGDAVLVMPKPEERADDFDLVRMKRQ
jgi:ribosomal protein S5